MPLTGAERAARYRTRRAAKRAALSPGVCHCGCGTVLPPIPPSGYQRRYILGHQPKRAPAEPDAERSCIFCGAIFRVPMLQVRRTGGKYCSRQCVDQARVGKRPPNWKGGLNKTTQGYLERALPGGARILEHRRIMQELLGRPLDHDEHVHHINGVRTDNRPENLQLLSTDEHMALHKGHTGRWSREYGQCIHCETTERPHYARGLCTRCYHRARRSRHH